MMPLNLRHQQWRYLFQLFWLLVFAVLVAGGVQPQVWAGLLGAGLISALFLKRAACSIACPLFPAGELLWRSGARCTGRNFAPPFWFDLVLRSAKYLVLLWLLLTIHGGSMRAMATALTALPLYAGTAALVILGLFYQLPWCRYLCPYGALLGLMAMASLLKIRRAPRHCVRCHRCSQRCPANLPVLLLTTVRSAECFACFRCVDGCPAPGALDLSLPGNRTVPAWVMGMVISCMLIFGALVGLVR